MWEKDNCAAGLQFNNIGFDPARKYAVLCMYRIQTSQTGPNPIKILQHKFCTTLILKHFDWLKILNIQSDCLKN